MKVRAMSLVTVVLSLLGGAGCVFSEYPRVDTKLTIKDKESGKPLGNCLLVTKKLGTRVGAQIWVMADDAPWITMPRVEEASVERINSGEKWVRKAVYRVAVPLGPFVVTKYKCVFCRLIREGYQITVLLTPRAGQRVTVVEMERDRPGNWESDVRFVDGCRDIGEGLSHIRAGTLKRELITILLRRLDAVLEVPANRPVGDRGYTYAQLHSDAQEMKTLLEGQLREPDSD